MQKNFEQTVKAMTAKEIIMAMVEGLQNPAVKVDMASYGCVSKSVCYGCAATNTICKISGKPFTQFNIYSRNGRSIFINTSIYFLSHFEKAIDYLRRGLIEEYNEWAEDGGFTLIKNNGFELNVINDDYTADDLQPYIDLANAQ